MLLIRRFPKQRIAIFDDRSEIWLTVNEVDMYNDTVILEARTTNTNEGRFLWIKVLELREPRKIFEDMVTVKLIRITSMEGGQDECTLGFDAPRHILIKSQELLRGITREYRSRMRE